LQHQDVTIAVDGGAMPSYLARPDGDAAKPAVIVLQEIFGVNREVRRIADLFASSGYVALAINYYHRDHPTLNEPYTKEGLQRGFAAAAKVDRATLRSDIAAAIAWLESQPYVSRGKIATTGFCFGGSVAFLSATMPGLTGAVCFYGLLASGMPSGEPAPIADAANVGVPLLLFFGGKDEFVDHDAIAKTSKALLDAGKESEIITYPNVGHAFFRESSADMNRHEVEDAWNKVLFYLGERFA